VIGAAKSAQSRRYDDFFKKLRYMKGSGYRSKNKKKPREHRGPPMGSSVRTDILDKTLLFSKPLTEVNQKTVLRVGESKHHIFQISVANRTRVLVDHIEFSENKMHLMFLLWAWPASF
jgi:hypothetical protein